jgi:hypothetical protein
VSSFTIRNSLITITLAAVLSPAAAQDLPRRLGGANAPPLSTEDTRPIPRLPDGTVDLGGVWSGGGPVEDIAKQGGMRDGEIEALMRPEALKLFQSRNPADDPYSYCMPAGVPRMASDFAWRFVQWPTTKPTHIWLLYEGNMHSYRQIFMDGRPHPEDPTPTWFGHSIGWWEGDTLVIDTVGFNDRFWFDRRGTPHTERLHTIERWTRTNFTTLERLVTIDDPGAYTKPWTVRYTARLGQPGSEILEYVCIENNQYQPPNRR